MANIQIRNVPPGVHRRLKARAAMAGKSLSEFALQELKQSLERLPREVFLDRVRELKPVRALPSPAQLIREERDAR